MRQRFFGLVIAITTKILAIYRPHEEGHGTRPSYCRNAKTVTFKLRHIAPHFHSFFGIIGPRLTYEHLVCRQYCWHRPQGSSTTSVPDTHNQTFDDNRFRLNDILQSTTRHGPFGRGISRRSSNHPGQTMVYGSELRHTKPNPYIRWHTETANTLKLYQISIWLHKCVGRK